MSRKALLKLVLVVVIVAAFVLTARMLPLGVWIAQFQEWVRGMGVVGYVAYVLLYVVFCVFLIPASPLTVGAGAIFGFAKGSVIVVIGATLGATASFLLARGALRQRVERMTAGNARFRALDRAIAKEGGRIVFLVRLAPLFPFAWINFAFGLTGIRTIPYVIATFFGIMPLTLVFVYVSAAAVTAATSDPGPLRLGLNIAGVLLTLLVTGYVTRLATREIRRAGVEEA